LLLKLPSAVAVTLTRTSHEVTPAAMAAPETPMTPVPGVAVTVNAGAARAPPAGQFVCTFGAAATTTPAGRLSVKPSPACAGLPAPFASVKVSTVGVPGAMDAVRKAFVSAGAAFTVRVAASPAAESPGESPVMLAGRLL